VTPTGIERIRQSSGSLPFPFFTKRVGREGWIAMHSLEAIERLCLARRVDVGLRPHADFGLAGWTGGFPPCGAERIGGAKSESAPAEGQAGASRKSWSGIPVSSVVRMGRAPVPRSMGRGRERSGVRRKAELVHDGGASRGTNRPRRTDPRSRRFGTCSGDQEITAPCMIILAVNQRRFDSVR